MGGLMVLGYAALTLLFQTAQMWVTPSVITARWNVASRIAYALLPDAWLNATPRSGIAPWIVGAYLLLLALLFLVYVRAARRAYAAPHPTPEDGRKVLLLILGVAGVSLLMLLMARAMLSPDIYSYVWNGRIGAMEGGNPYLEPPNNYLDRDLEGWMEWEVWNGALPCVYGPVWVVLAEGIAYLAQAVGGKELAVHVLGHRLLADIAHLINIWLMWRVAGEFRARMLGKVGNNEVVTRKWAGLQVGATLTYAWNPLVMLEFGLSGHNDAIMIAFLLVSIWLLLKGMWRWAAVALAAAALVKLMALLFFPFYLLWLWRISRGEGEEGEGSRRQEAAGAWAGLRTGVSRGGQALAIVTVCWLLAMWPFGGPGALFEALDGNPTVNLQINSVAAAILAGIPATLYASITPWVRWGQQALAGLLLAVVFWKCLRAAGWGVPSVVEGWGWALLVYFMVGAPWFWPWYVTWLFLPLALVGTGRLWTAGQVLAASAISIYAIFPPPAGLEGWENYTGLIVVLPTSLYLLASWLLDRGGLER